MCACDVGYCVMSCQSVWTIYKRTLMCVLFSDFSLVNLLLFAVRLCSFDDDIPHKYMFCGLLIFHFSCFLFVISVLSALPLLGDCGLCELCSPVCVFSTLLILGCALLFCFACWISCVLIVLLCLLNFFCFDCSSLPVEFLVFWLFCFACWISCVLISLAPCVDANLLLWLDHPSAWLQVYAWYCLIQNQFVIHYHHQSGTSLWISEGNSNSLSWCFS